MTERIESGPLTGVTITHKPAGPGRVESWVLESRDYGTTTELDLSSSGHLVIRQTMTSGSSDGSYYEEKSTETVYSSDIWLIAALELLHEKMKGESVG